MRIEVTHYHYRHRQHRPHKHHRTATVVNQPSNSNNNNNDRTSSSFLNSAMHRQAAALRPNLDFLPSRLRRCSPEKAAPGRRRCSVWRTFSGSNGTPHSCATSPRSSRQCTDTWTAFVINAITPPWKTLFRLHLTKEKIKN